MNQTEKRELLSSEIEIREVEGGLRTITGYAVKWEMKSVTMGYWRRFKEQFKRGAFTDSLTQDDQLALWSHDYSQVLGRTKNGTLRLFEDEIGLRFELDLADTTLGDDTYKTIKRGDVDGVSFGFQMVKEEWDESDPDNIVRSVTKAKLVEISPVAFPAYPDSQVSARSHDPYKQFVDERNQKDLRKKLILKTYL
ncbi:HK97 family phage prohead protease [Bacillus thuringiensis]|uniref:HK97 family phage prohead protease n=1 Tax=Bacillus cereus group TaxID=86661 RepID=UPI0003063117|nr:MULTISPECIES: HK97 family phage prohead protease [Bacillus cereus group]MBH0323368.1 HK97 family phage prohead protease [Bacillus cereus]MEB4894255.1 HK97 family phage prohead protease [Bacillus thuringiensis]MEC2563236.1 HK97 family phage prohead protease [Bacillus thuringiensis]MEC2643741.1 HK97 family phage prohead protease [Bacillus thuringiensis]MEC2725946.1 HK97 family phage prohead protease [Bacillus thuringiensis]